MFISSETVINRIPPFGGCDGTTRAPPVIRVRGVVLFGGVDIVRKPKGQ